MIALLAACAPAPMTPERAERLCRDEAGLADGVQGRIAIGVGSGGPAGSAEITLTDRILRPQTEEDFLADCIARRLAGRPPPATAGITIERSL